ncbi:hypothetical protein PGTUg99_030431 [Puccinia graminis f. sp. tritici]|uniref:Uncharacterized protein n=1 Tax=Puccinia graminis f. sp. tritici TaxID=56615 RepID=A0A5B0MIA2_PUCGR|nr:hypothetical protein PGTUg99_030431 [Puccinia graminis f. sp. tritici]
MRFLKSLFVVSCVSPLGAWAASSPTPIIDPQTTFTCFDAKKEFKVGWCVKLSGIDHDMDSSTTKVYTVTKANQVGPKIHDNYNCKGIKEQSNKCCRADWIQVNL